MLLSSSSIPRVLINYPCIFLRTIMPRKASSTLAATPPVKRARMHATTDQSPPAPPTQQQQLFLLKSEPDEFSIDDLEAAGAGTGCKWEGVRNAQAANILRSMRVGDLALFYHSSCKDKGVVGICRVVREAYPDDTAWDPESKYYDVRNNNPDKPKWVMVDITFVRRLRRCIPLATLKQQTALQGMQLLTRPRLSVQQVSREHWHHVLSLEEEEEGEEM